MSPGQQWTPHLLKIMCFFPPKLNLVTFMITVQSIGVSLAFFSTFVTQVQSVGVPDVAFPAAVRGVSIPLVAFTNTSSVLALLLVVFS